MYANTTTGKREHVQKSKDSKVLQLMRFGSAQGRIVQTIESSTTTYVGLNYTDANGLLAQAGESSTLNNVTRAFLGSAKLTVSSGGGSSWATVDNCWGTKVTVSI